MQLVRSVTELDRRNVVAHAKRLYPTRDPTGDSARTSDRNAFESLDFDSAPAVICDGAAVVVAACDLGLLDTFSSDRRPSQVLIGRALLMLNPALADTSAKARAARKARHLPEDVDADALGLCVTRQNDRDGRNRRPRTNGKGDTQGAFARIRKALMFTVDDPIAMVKTRRRNRRRTAKLIARGAGGGRSGSSCGRRSYANERVAV